MLNGYHFVVIFHFKNERKKKNCIVTVECHLKTSLEYYFIHYANNLSHYLANCSHPSPTDYTLLDHRNE